MFTAAVQSQDGAKHNTNPNTKPDYTEDEGTVLEKTLVPSSD